MLHSATHFDDNRHTTSRQNVHPSPDDNTAVDEQSYQIYDFKVEKDCKPGIEQQCWLNFRLRYVTHIFGFVKKLNIIFKQGKFASGQPKTEVYIIQRIKDLIFTKYKSF